MFKQLHFDETQFFEHMTQWLSTLSAGIMTTTTTLRWICRKVCWNDDVDEETGDMIEWISS